MHRSIAPDFLHRLLRLYKHISPGDPLEANTLYGPMHTRAAVDIYSDAIQHLRSTKAEILTGGMRYDTPELAAGNFVQPTVAIPVSSDTTDPVWSTETFAPILKVALFDDFEQAIAMNNGTPQVS